MANLIQELINKVNNLTTVVNSIINNAKDMEALPNASTPLNDADLIRVVQSGLDRKTAVSNINGANDASTRMRWKNRWVNAAYTKFDVVVDGSWTMVANKDTTERAAPQAIDSPRYIYEDTIGSATNTEKRVQYGMSYHNANNAFFLTGYRIWLVSGQYYNIFSITGRGTPQEVITQLLNFTANSGGWQHVGINDILVPQNSKIDLIVSTRETEPVVNETLANYDYDTPGGGGQTPSSGEIKHNNNNTDNLLISKTDADGGDQSAMLLGLNDGDIIFGGLEWTVQGATVDNGTYVTIGILPEIQSSDGLKTFTFKVVTASSLSYGYDEDEWLGDLYVRGLFDPALTPGTYNIDDLLENDNQYGIDVQVQNVAVSDDWDFLASTDTLGGGPDTGDTPIEIVDNLTTQDADKALSANQGYVLDQNKSDINHTHPNPKGTVIESAVDYDTGSKDASSGATLVMKPGGNAITLDSTGLTIGWFQQAVNNIGGTLEINKAPTDSVIGLLPGYVPDTQMVFYQLVAAGVFVVAYGDEVAAHSLTDHVDVSVSQPVEPNAALTFNQATSLWEPKVSYASLGMVDLAYKLQKPWAGDPPAGYINQNTTNPSSVEYMWLDTLDQGGYDQTTFIEALKTLDNIQLINAANGADYEEYTVTGPAVKNGSTWTLPVVFNAASGTVLQDEADLVVRLRIAPDVFASIGGSLTAQQIGFGDTVDNVMKGSDDLRWDDFVVALKGQGIVIEAKGTWNCYISYKDINGSQKFILGYNGDFTKVIMQASEKLDISSTGTIELDPNDKVDITKATNIDGLLTVNKGIYVSPETISSDSIGGLLNLGAWRNILDFRDATGNKRFVVGNVQGNTGEYGVVIAGRTNTDETPPLTLLAEFNGTTVSDRGAMAFDARHNGNKVGDDDIAFRFSSGNAFPVIDIYGNGVIKSIATVEEIEQGDDLILVNKRYIDDRIGPRSMSETGVFSSAPTIVPSSMGNRISGFLDPAKLMPNMRVDVSILVTLTSQTRLALEELQFYMAYNGGSYNILAINLTDYSNIGNLVGGTFSFFVNADATEVSCQPPETINSNATTQVANSELYFIGRTFTLSELSSSAIASASFNVKTTGGFSITTQANYIV